MTRVHGVQSESPRKRAMAVVVVAVFLPVLLGFAALTVDLGYLYNVRADLQCAADASAMAVAGQLINDYKVGELRAFASELARRNHPGHGSILRPEDVTFGFWDRESDQFWVMMWLSAECGANVMSSARGSISDIGPRRHLDNEFLGGEESVAR